MWKAVPYNSHFGIGKKATGSSPFPRARLAVFEIFPIEM
jgi:hypothetical protein